MHASTGFSITICKCWARRLTLISVVRGARLCIQGESPTSHAPAPPPPFPPWQRQPRKRRIIWSVWKPHEDYTECGVIRPPAFWCNVNVGCPAGWDLPPMSHPRQSRARGQHGRPRARVEPTGKHYSCSKPPLLDVHGDGEMEKIHPPRFPSVARALGTTLQHYFANPIDQWVLPHLLVYNHATSSRIICLVAAHADPEASCTNQCCRKRETEAAVSVS
eukprot:235631-Chlamydomonas_euryale.AAC.1